MALQACLIAFNRDSRDKEGEILEIFDTLWGRKRERGGCGDIFFVEDLYIFPLKGEEERDIR